MFFQISRRVFTQPDYQHLCFTATTVRDATSSRVICHCKKQEQEATCVMRELFSENCHLLFKTKIPSLQFWRRRRRQCGFKGNNRPKNTKRVQHCYVRGINWHGKSWFHSTFPFWSLHFNGTNEIWAQIQIASATKAAVLIQAHE